MPTIPKGYKRSAGSFFVPLFILLGSQALAADNFFFPPGNNPPAGLYQVTNVKTFVVNARTGGVLDGSYNDIVTVGLYSTINPNPPTQISDPAVTLTGNLGTFTGGGPVSFNAGAVTFTLKFESGSDSEQVYLADSGGTPVTTGDSYPGVFAGSIGGAALTVQGFSTAYYLDTVSQTSQPASYTSGSTNYDILTANPATIAAMASTFLDVGVTITQASGVTGVSGIDNAADAFAVTNISGGYAAGGASILNSMYFEKTSGASSPIIQCQVIIDYAGTLTDFNNPVTNLDTVYSFSAAVNSTLSYSTANFVGGPVANYLPFQPFINNGQVIVRIWNTSATNTVLMRYMTSGGQQSNLSDSSIPYSSGNIQPVLGTLSPLLFADGQPSTMVYKIKNQFTSPVSQVIYELRPNNPVTGTPWSFSSITGPNASSGFSNPTAGGAAGSITINFSPSLAFNQTAPITMIGTASDQTGSYPISMTGATNASNGLPAPTDPSIRTINTLGIPNTPQTFTAVPINYTGIGESVSLAWSPVTNESSQGYVLTRSPVGGNFSNPVTLPVPGGTTVINNAITLTPANSNLNFIDSPVTNLTGYTYTIEAFNNVAQSPSTSVGPVTAFANPGTPGPVTALTGGPTIQLSWSTPSSVNGSYAVTGYQVWRDTQPSLATAVTIASLGLVTTYNDTGLAAGTYYYGLTSLDSQYTAGAPPGPHISPLSAAVSGSPPDNPPLNIGVSLVVPTSPATIGLSWNAPQNYIPADAPVSYVVYKATTSPVTTAYSAMVTVAAATVSINDGGAPSTLTAGYAYSYYVVALDGQGFTSNASTTMTQQVGPSVPTGLAYSPGASAITLTWNPNPAQDGVAHYNVFRNGVFLAQTGSSPQSYMDNTGLSVGTDYGYYLQAVNGASVTGPNSATVSAAEIPMPPSSVTAAVTTSENVAVSWVWPSPAEGNLQNFFLQQLINGSPTTLHVTIPVTGSGVPVTYLDTTIGPANAGSTIQYYMFDADDLGGGSFPNYTVVFSNSVVIPPNAPALPSATSSASAVTLNWAPNSGQGVTQYTVYRSQLPSGPTTQVIGNVSGAVSTYTDATAAMGVNYYYNIGASNPGGASPLSPPVTWGLSPSAATGLAVAGLDTNNDISVTWTGVLAAVPNASSVSLLVNSGPTTTAAAVTNLSPASAVSYFDNGLVNAAVTGESPDTTYYYWLETNNPYGTSVTTAPVSQLTYPAPVSLVSVVLDTDGISRDLTWVTVGGGDVASYNIYREQVGASSFVSVGSASAAGLTFPVKRTNSITPGKSYIYEITAVNATGEGTSSNQVTIGIPPSAPTSVTAVSGTSNLGVTVNLNWADLNVTSEGVTGFTVYRAFNNTSTASYSAVATITSLTYNYSDGAVTGTGLYYYLVAADDNSGKESILSTANAVSVTAFALPNPPAAPGETDGTAQATLNWSAAGLATTYPLSGFNLYRSTSAGVTGVKVNATPIPTSPLTDSGLTDGTTYYYSLQAVDNQGNLSAVSPQQSAEPVAPPGIPGNVSGASGNNAVQVTWNPSLAGSLPVSFYEIQKITLSGPATSFIQVASNFTGYVDNTVSNGATYVYQVEAVDSNSNGVTTGVHVSGYNANPVTLSPGAGVNPPSSVAALGSNGSVAVTWTDAFAGGAAVTAYQLYRATALAGPYAGVVTVASGVETITDSGLTNGTTYYYYLIDQNNLGSTSSHSATVFATPASPPLAPTPVVGVDGVNQAALTWGASPAEGVVTIGSYVIDRAVLPGALAPLASTSGAVTTYTDSTPANDGQTVVYEVAGVNSNGTTGVFSLPVTDFPYAAFAPTGLSTTAGTTTVAMTWTAPASPSWAPVTQYQVTRTILGGAAVTTFFTASAPMTDTTAVQGQLYIYTVAAIDSKGHLSGASNPVTDGPCNPPAAPATLIVSPGSQQVLIDWPASANVAGSIPVSFYLLTINSGAPVTIPAAQTWYLDNNNGAGLTDPAGVTVSLAAVDDSGVTTGNHISTLAGPVTVTTNVNNLNPPTGLTATALGLTSVQLNWARPNDLGRTVLYYSLYRSNNFNGPFTNPVSINNSFLAPVTTYTDNSVGPNSTYYYVMTATYSQGASQVASPNSNHALVVTPSPATAPPPVTTKQFAFDANLLKPLTGQKLTIYFSPPNSGPVEFDVYNISGDPVRALYGTAVAGAQGSVVWDGKDRNGNTVASGIYLIEIKAPSFHQVKKVLVVK